MPSRAEGAAAIFSPKPTIRNRQRYRHDKEGIEVGMLAGEHAGPPGRVFVDEHAGGYDRLARRAGRRSTGRGPCPGSKSAPDRRRSQAEQRRSRAHRRPPSGASTGRPSRRRRWRRSLGRNRTGRHRAALFGLVAVGGDSLRNERIRLSNASTPGGVPLLQGPAAARGQMGDAGGRLHIPAVGRVL